MKRLPALVRLAIMLCALLIFTLTIMHLTLAQEGEVSSSDGPAAAYLAITDTPEEPEETPPPEEGGNGDCTSPAVMLPLAVVSIAWWTFRQRRAYS